MIWKIRRLFLCMGAALIACSCTRDGLDEVKPDEKVNSIRFTLSVPGVAVPQPSTRGLTDSQEEALASVDVLVFHAAGSHSGTFMRREKGTHVSGTTYEVKLPEGTYDLVVLGNATSIIDNTSGLIPQTITKADAVALLTVSNPGGYWTGTTIPMWGYADGVVVNETTSLTGNNAIDLTRMTAKIEVRLSPAAAGTNNDNFELKSVRLYNYNTNGRLAPEAVNWNPAGGVVNAGKGIATAPSLPSNPGAVTGKTNPLVFQAAQGVTAKDLLNSIYTFEAVKGSDLTLSANTCLVIGGSFEGGAETFYRVDFARASGGATTYLDLLRNHRYIVTINSVTAPGHETPEEAFDSRSFNIEIGILEWEESDLEDVWIDGQYYYSIKPLKGELWAAAANGNAINVRTDYHTWSFELSDLPTPGDPYADPSTLDWLDIKSHTPGSDNAGNPAGEDIIYDVTLNTTGGSRVAYLHYTFGRFQITGTITQTMKGLTSISISPSGQDIPSEGAQRTIIATGDYDDITIIARDRDTGEIFAAATIPASTSGSSVDIIIPQYWFTDDPTQITTRHVVFQYMPLGGTQWYDIETQKQESCYINIEVYDDLKNNVKHTEGAEITSYHAEFTVRAWGNLPAVLLRGAVDGQTDISRSGTSYIVPGVYDASRPARGHIIFYGNPTGYTREVHLQYSIDGGFTWVDISKGPQPRFAMQNSGEIIAVDNARLNGTTGAINMTWAQAMGIPAGFNTTQFWGTANGGSSPENDDYTPTVATGCNAYWERDPSDPVYGVGKWRVGGFGKVQNHWLMMDDLAYLDQSFDAGLKWPSVASGNYRYQTWTSYQEYIAGGTASFACGVLHSSVGNWSGLPDGVLHSFTSLFYKTQTWNVPVRCVIKP